MGSIEDVSFKIEENSGAENGKKFKIVLNVPMKRGFIENVKMIIDNKEYPLCHRENKNGMAVFETTIELQTSAIYHYYFSFEENGNFIIFKKKGNTDNKRVSKDEMWKMSVNFKVPNWAKGKIMYHIFVDRFKKSDDSLLTELPHRHIHKSWNEDLKTGPDEEGRWNTDFYGGNIRGIIDSLDYIKSLGVSIIYLSPIVKSQSNHRYDTADYEEIDPYIGTEKDLKELCEKAHKKGMKIILDAVFNHTGNDSKYFNEYGTYDTIGAYQSIYSPYYDFYKKKDNNFEYWWGMKNLPVCDDNSKHWQDYIYGKGGIIDKWFKLGIDGLRLDVADELTDEFIEGIRKAVKRNKEDGFIIGEVWKNPMRMNRSYISSGKGMDTVMDYLLVDALIRYLKYSDVDKIKDILNQIQNEYPDDTIKSLMNFTSTHDISRAVNIFGTNRFKLDGEWSWNLLDEDYNKSSSFTMSNEEYKKAIELLKTYLFTLTFMPGNISIFYGDEIGIIGEGNLSNRKPYPWDNQDKELLEYFKTIGEIRKKEPFLENAELNILDINGIYLMFERIGEDFKTLTTINRTDKESLITIPSEYENHSKIYTLKKSTKNVLKPYGGITLKK
ncbi:MAG: glycoside hydrolase family 13 protein [Bacilli bacterium]|nr:glycoside hydrolase family 13 protein [Bacilli bacterium]